MQNMNDYFLTLCVLNTPSEYFWDPYPCFSLQNLITFGAYTPYQFDLTPQSHSCAPKTALTKLTELKSQDMSQLLKTVRGFIAAMEAEQLVHW